MNDLSANPPAVESRKPWLETVTLKLCSLCLNGAGGTCETRGCALYKNQAPDIPLWHVKVPAILDLEEA